MEGEKVPLPAELARLIDHYGYAGDKLAYEGIEADKLVGKKYNLGCATG